MRRSLLLAFLGLAALVTLIGALPSHLILPGMPTAAAPSGSPASSIASSPSSSLVRTMAPAVTVGPGASSTTSTLGSPAASGCAGPIPTWSGSNFFCDAVVSFAVLGQSTPANIPLVPQVGTVSEWAPGFWVNVSTNVPLLTATVYIWATEWPTTPGAPATNGTPVPGFDPANSATSQDSHPMVICNQTHASCPTRSPDDATYYFDDDTYFFPGTALSFTITLQTGSGAQPGTIQSQNTVEVAEPYNTLGVTTFPTWEVQVLGPFASTNFSNDIRLNTTPSITNIPQISPNPTQSVQVYLTSYNLSGGAATPIPAASFNGFIVTGRGAAAVSTTLTLSFSPANSTQMHLTVPILPEPSGTMIEFNVTAWQWLNGNSVIDKITSPEYYFNFTSGGLDWPNPGGSLEQNLVLNATPLLPGPATSVLTAEPTHLPTGTIVNVTIHEPKENVTIGPSEVEFTFNDRGAGRTGAVNMHAINANTSFVLLPGLPPNASLTFRVVAKDSNLNPTFSSNYTYFENGTPVPGNLGDEGYFFLEVYDVSTGRLVSGVNFTVSNETWFQSTSTLSMGFGSLLSYTTNQFVQLHVGTYVVALSVFGHSFARAVSIASSEPFTIVFYVASAPVTISTAAPPPLAAELAGVIGLVGGLLVSFPLMAWFRERRAQAEAEQRRVTL